MSRSNELSAEKSYLGEASGATARLKEVVMVEIESQGPISFLDFMARALYHPEWGYYARKTKVRTGKEGDFFTAVSVGSLFGRILAEHAYECWQNKGKPNEFRVVEWGAEQGDLARDILAGAREIGGEFEKVLQYAVVEPLPAKHAFLSENLPEVEVVAQAGALSKKEGLVIANELIDAFPFWLVRREDGRWLEKRVARQDEVEEGFQFELAEPSGELVERLRMVEGRFSEGYETEVRPSVESLLTEMRSVLAGGELLLFDYGFERQDLYHPSRITGTLRTFGKHEAGEDPLVDVGELDITAHVDFTALAEEARSAGFAPQALESQGAFLTKAAAGILRGMEGQVDLQFIRQFQTLTHPGHLGSRFSLFRALA